MQHKEVYATIKLLNIATIENIGTQQNMQPFF